MENQQEITKIAKSNSTLYYILLLWQLVFAAIIVYVIKSGLFSSPFIDKSNTFLIPSVIFSLACLGLSYFLFNKKLETLKRQPNVSKRLMGYRSLIVLRLGILEMASILNLGFYLATSSDLFLIIAGLIIIVFMLFAPNRNKMIADLELHSDI